MAVTATKQRVPIDMALLQILNQRFENRADDPDVLLDGHVWYNTTDKMHKRVEDGVIVPFFTAADAAKLAAFETAISNAQAAADAAQEQLDSITSDNILSKYEKPAVKIQYDLLVAEKSGIDAIAATYGITTEKTNYDNAVTALVSYMAGLLPAYTDYTQDTVIVGTTFRGLFTDVYNTRQLLSSAISQLAYDALNVAEELASDAKILADQAIVDAANALLAIGAAADDGLLGPLEKLGIVQQYDILIAERTGIDAQADEFVITAEKTAYDNAVIALTAYITGLVPAYNDYTTSTVVVRDDFNNAFELVYSTKQALLNAIYAAAKLLADDAAIIARSKGRHFIVEPTTPYYVGDLYSDGNDLFRCIVQRLVGAYNAADWEVATHYDVTQTIIDGGLITTGRVEVGGGALGTGNAGMNGSVSGVPTTDIRFWAGADYANRATAPWRVQDNGEFWGTIGHIGGWNVDSDSIYTGTKHVGNGFSAAAGDITIKSDGSIHAKTFYINADGTSSIYSDLPHLTRKGVGAVPGDLRNSNDAEVSTVSDGYVLVKTIKFTNGFIGSMKIGFGLKFDVNGGTGTTAYGQLYINNTPLGTEQTRAVNAYLETTEDITQNFLPGDELRVYAKTDDVLQVGICNIHWLRLYYINDPVIEVVSTNS